MVHLFSYVQCLKGELNFYSKTCGLTIKIPETNENLVTNLLHSERFGTCLSSTVVYPALFEVLYSFRILTVDETLLSFRDRFSFKMFIPSKPDKYGLKIISLSDARTFYLISGIPYVGKEGNKKKGDLNLPTQYVLTLTESVRPQHK